MNDGPIARCGKMKDKHKWFHSVASVNHECKKEELVHRDHNNVYLLRAKSRERWRLTLFASINKIRRIKYKRKKLLWVWVSVDALADVLKKREKKTDGEEKETSMKYF